MRLSSRSSGLLLPNFPDNADYTTRSCSAAWLLASLLWKVRHCHWPTLRHEKGRIVTGVGGSKLQKRKTAPLFTQLSLLCPEMNQDFSRGWSTNSIPCPSLTALCTPQPQARLTSSLLFHVVQHLVKQSNGANRYFNYLGTRKNGWTL